METPRSRRSGTNLNHLSLAPLSSSVTAPELGVDSQQTSYIQGRSAPTTPGILSRNSSGHRLSSRVGFTEALSKSKSTTVLQRGTGKRKTKSTIRLSADHGEWFFRAGAAISSEARESKGQGWLISRESSTSLVAQNDDTTSESPFLSRAASRRTSRPVSQVTSRADLNMAEITDYFGSVSRDASAMAGPDFVDEEDEEEEEEEEDEDEEESDVGQQEEDEVAKLAKDGRSFGLGGLVDKMVQWTMFNEDDADVEDDGEEHEEARKKRDHDARITGRPAAASDKVEEKNREAGGWSDAAWLLSVASKVLL